MESNNGLYVTSKSSWDIETVLYLLKQKYCQIHDIFIDASK